MVVSDTDVGLVSVTELSVELKAAEGVVVDGLVVVWLNGGLGFVTATVEALIDDRGPVFSLVVVYSV